ncbi:MAG: DNA-binding response regulator [Actinobacteria bacterium RBG_16_64_13]|nr:MAG: DNA-binding response regulator [Actinobacteria bacterium RBG_16_64_13]
MTAEGSLEKIRVLIVDDHQVVRQGLRTFLELHDDILVVGEAADGRAAVDMVLELQPHVVLMDLVMPRLDGIGATKQIMEAETGARVIALTSFAEDDQVFPAIQAGASSYLLKDVSPDELIDAIRAAYRGEPRLHPDVARKLMDAMRNAGAVDGATRTGPAHSADEGPSSIVQDLTDREREVIALVAKGKSNQEIARQFFISEKTVKTHISHILAKLGLKDRTQLAIFAIRNDLADDE